MLIVRTLVLICLASASAAEDIGVKPRKFITATEHAQITSTYMDRNQSRQARELYGLWAAFLAKNGKLGHLQKQTGDDHLLTTVLNESIGNVPLDTDSPSQTRSIHDQLRRVSDELVDCYRYYRDLRYTLSCYYRKGTHDYPVTDLEMGLQTKVVSSYSFGPMQEEARRFRSDLVQLCGKKAIDKLDAGFKKSGWYFPKEE
jgi:hypothetical protein